MNLGEYPILFFGNRSLKDPKETCGSGAVVFCYILTGLLPIAKVVLSIIQTFDIFKITELGPLLFFLIISHITWRKKIVNNFLLIALRRLGFLGKKHRFWSILSKL